MNKENLNGIQHILRFFKQYCQQKNNKSLNTFQYDLVTNKKQVLYLPFFREEQEEERCAELIFDMWDREEIADSFEDNLVILSILLDSEKTPRTKGEFLQQKKQLIRKYFKPLENDDSKTNFNCCNYGIFKNKK